jgi:hypothetical protein
MLMLTTLVSLVTLDVRAPSFADDLDEVELVGCLENRLPPLQQYERVLYLAGRSGRHLFPPGIRLRVPGSASHRRDWSYLGLLSGHVSVGRCWLIPERSVATGSRC